jgi:UDP-N-acetylmuramate--alanine ligase
VGEAGGVLCVDDYAHHPTAIRSTLAGFREFYAGRRVVVDFMPHTYTRTARLLSEFATSFADADVVVLHDVYASARERRGTVTGRDLCKAVSAHHINVHYFEEPLDALPFCRDTLRPGDVLVTMGAGNNWQLGRASLGGALRTPVGAGQQ